MLTVKQIYRQLKRLHQDESGQSTTEYVLILSAVVMIAIKFKSSIGKQMEKMVGEVGNKISEGIQE